jgi:hypothetical protein
VELVREGLSPCYTKYGASKNYAAAFKAAEKFARENKKGIWAASGLPSRAPAKKQTGTRAKGHRVKFGGHKIIDMVMVDNTVELSNSIFNGLNSHYC